MSRYDDLRRIREAKFAATKAATDKPSVETLRTLITPAQQIPIIDATKTPMQRNATKVGRPLIGDKPMPATERSRRFRERHSTTQPSSL